MVCLAWINALWFTVTLCHAEPPQWYAGRRLPSEKRVLVDSKTGREVTALTTHAAADDKIYQTHPSWTADGKWIIFQSQRAEGTQLFAAQEQTGELVQITGGPSGHGSACLSRKQNALLMTEGRQVFLLDLGPILSGKSDRPGSAQPPKLIGEIPEGATWSGLPSWDADESVLYIGLEWPKEPTARRWSVHAMDLSQGTCREIVWQNFRITHVQASPFVPGLFMYAQETAGDAEQRMWLARLDRSEHRPFYKETYDEWVTHEVWWDADHALFTIWPKNEEMRKKPHGIASVDLRGTLHVHSQFPYWHVTSSNGHAWSVGDTFDGEIFRVDLKSGDRTLLTQGHRVDRKGSHPHPTLSPDGKRVLFVSHLLGNTDLFLVDVP